MAGKGPTAARTVWERCQTPARSRVWEDCPTLAARLLQRGPDGEPLRPAVTDATSLPAQTRLWSFPGWALPHF